MALEYRVQSVPNAPGKYYAQHVEQGVSVAATSIREIAEKTQQTEAVVRAVLAGTGQYIVECVLAGQGVEVPGVGKCIASIEATLTAINDPLPEDRRARVRITLDRSLMDQINEQVQFTRLPADNLAPIIQTFTVENGAANALGTSCLVTLRGTSLTLDLGDSSQGVFLQGPSGSPIRVPNEKMKTHTDGQTAFFWPTGTTADTAYTIYIKGARKGSDLVRQSNSIAGFHTA